MHHNMQGGDSCDCTEDFQGCLWSLGSDCGESRGELCQDIPHLPHLQYQVKNLSVASEMVKSMAIEAQAAREANSMLVMQNGEGRSLEKIRYLEGYFSQIPVLVQFNITRGWRRKTTTIKFFTHINFLMNMENGIKIYLRPIQASNKPLELKS